MTKQHFIKDQATGGWLFDGEFGGRYMALRNIAGFAGRDWSLYRENRAEVTGSTDIALMDLVDEQFASRAEAAEAGHKHSEQQYRQNVTFNANGALVL